MADAVAEQQGRDMANVVYGPAGHFSPEVSNLRSYVQHVLDLLKQYDPNSQLRGYLQDSIHDLANFGRKKLQGRNTTPDAPKLATKDLMLSFVTIPQRSDSPVDQLSPDDNLDKFLGEFRKKLFESGDAMMSICCLAPTPIEDVGAIMSLRSKMFGSPSRIRRKYEAPRIGIILTIDEYWLLGTEICENLLGITNAEERLLIPAENFTAQASESVPFLRDLDWNRFEFEWCRDPPNWTSSFDMYIWALHTTQPKVEGVTVYVRQVQPRWEVLLAYRQTQDETYSNPRRLLVDSRNAFGATPADLECPELIAIRLMLSIASLLCEDNRKFRDSCLNRISQLTLKIIPRQRLSGRKRPSREKINFLLHLDDHRQCGLRGIRRTKGLVQDISDFAKQVQLARSQAVDAVSERCDKLARDLGNLEHDLRSLGEMFTETSDMIKMQVDLEQISFTGVLALLAAIYLPFTFTAGMFGMNLKDPLWSTSTSHTSNKTSASSKLVSSQSNLTTQSQLSSATAIVHATTTSPAPALISTDSANLTASFAAALASQPGSYLFNFKQFWYIAVSVTAATIFLPIVVGPAFRATVQFSYNHREVWRLLVFLTLATGSITLGVLEGFIAACVFGTIQAFLALFMLIKRSRKPTNDKPVNRWILYASVVAGCMSFDLLHLNWAFDPKSSILTSISSLRSGYTLWPSLTGVVAPFWLFYLWVWNDRPLPEMANIDRLSARIPLLPMFLNKIDHLKNNHLATRESRAALRSIFILFGCGFNVMLSLFLPFGLYLGLVLTYFGLYGVHKCLVASTRRDSLADGFSGSKITWLIFEIVVVLSSLFWIFSNLGVLMGAPGLFPWLALRAIYSKRFIPWVFRTLRQAARAFRSSRSATAVVNQAQDSTRHHQQV
ncbi:uncharacterized protein PV07_06228 [Cladophialophora immunda]|uniref:Uncharacterized protein n=1 Tax=Cladophialophora immunda TaxID=569365 RepID=A0A0D1ZR64_9EURO|nr:uncharacterized protein PV07_06228 [Cladophialophora immunda]KIW30486.1 hypothetical protein PV07_06228 [Cladophialophora immunda]OQU97077.1 hypothetical protein CLAIMM_03077 [Cladophialophora immunda]